jgi:hypothetical protein
LRQLIAGAILALALPGAASAVTFSGNWSASGPALADTGLEIETQPGAAGPNAFSWDVNDGETKAFSLFRIFTDETHVNWGDDDVPQALSVNFSLNSHAASGSVNGTSNGHNILLAQWGSVDWSGPLVLDLGTGLLSIVLNDVAHFNKGLFGLKEGIRHGADITANVSYSAAAPIPLPAGLGLILAGAGALGAAGFRRKPAA